MNWETIMCLGDSITIGARSYLGYPEYCGQELSQRTNKRWNVVNHATSGFTTINLVRHLDQNFSHLKACKPEILTLLIGTNDLKSQTGIEQFTIAYNQAVTKARLIVGNNNVVLIEIPKLVNGVMLPYRIEMNETAKAYNKVIEQIAASEKLVYHSMQCDNAHFYDGVHLNEEGSKNWGHQLANLIVKLRTA